MALNKATQRQVAGKSSMVTQQALTPAQKVGKWCT